MTATVSPPLKELYEIGEIPPAGACAADHVCVVHPAGAPRAAGKRHAG